MDSSTSLILDFETLETDPSAIVIEFGCVAFHRKTFKPIETLDLRPKFLPQLADGRTYSEDTLRWHEKKRTMPESTERYADLAGCAAVLMDFITRHNPYRIWAWGKDFERPLLENICKHSGIPIPQYQFRKFACARDKWQDAFGMEALQPERTHHALQDCLDELRDLRRALKSINLLRVA